MPVTVHEAGMPRPATRTTDGGVLAGNGLLVVGVPVIAPVDGFRRTPGGTHR